MPKPGAAIYARSSKDRSDVSIAAQVNELRELAAARGLEVREVFEDAVESGATDNRPGFGALARALKDRSRGWDVLLVYDTSRIARRRYLAQAFKFQCRRAGVSIQYAKLPADLDPVSEVVIESVFEAFDEVHSLLSRDKAVSGMRENVRRGFRAGGRAPLGYRLEREPTGAIRDGKPVLKSRLVPNEDAPKVAEYLRRRARGEPRPRILRELGVDWKANSLVFVERNALTYAGATVWNRHAQDGSRERPRSDWQVTRDTHPALISETEAEALLERLAASSHGERTSAGKRAASSALLSGLLVDESGRPWIASGRHYRLPAGPGRPRSRYVRREELERAVLDRIAEDVSSDSFLEGLLEAARKVAPDHSSSIRRDLARIRREKDRAARLAIETEDPSPWLELVAERTRQAAALERELEGLKAESELEVELRRLTPASLRALVLDLDPRRLTESLLERVVLSPDLDGRLEYRAAPAGSRSVSVASPRGAEGYEAPAAVSRFRLAA